MARGPGENPPVAARQWGGGGEERAASVHTFTACPRGGVRWLRGNPLAAACPISGAAPPCSPGRGAGPNRRVRRLPPVDGGAAPTPRRHLPAPRVGGRGGHHPALSQWPRPAVDEVLPRGCSSPRPPCRLAFPCRTTPRCASTADRLWGAPPPRRASAFRAEGARGDGAHAGCRVAFAFVEGPHTLTKPSAEMVGYLFRVQRKPHGRRRLRRHSRPPTMSSQLCRALVAPRPSPDVGHLWWRRRPGAAEGGGTRHGSGRRLPAKQRRPSPTIGSGTHTAGGARRAVAAPGDVNSMSPAVWPASVKEIGGRRAGHTSQARGGGGGSRRPPPRRAPSYAETPARILCGTRCAAGRSAFFFSLLPPPRPALGAGHRRRRHLARATAATLAKKQRTATDKAQNNGWRRRLCSLARAAST